MTTKSELEAALASHGITIESEFVPFSRSRNAKEKHKSLNWRVTVLVSGRKTLVTDYSAGDAYCPSFPIEWPHIMTADQSRAVAHECEHGFKAKIDWSGNPYSDKKKPIKPDLADVMYSLLMDADVLEYGTFENWADNLGFDPDSRKAHAIWQQCIEHSLLLRAALGEKALAELRELANDY